MWVVGILCQCQFPFIYDYPVLSVYTERERDRERERERGFSSWNSLVICRRTVQIECERLHFIVRATDRLDCPQSEFCQKFFCY